MKKPPIGLRPEIIWIEGRAEEIRDAISRYVEAEIDIPWKWIEELTRLESQIQKSRIPKR